MHTQSNSKMLMAASLSTLDLRRRIHKHALGLKWTLAPSPCFPADPRGPAPEKEAKTATCIWNSHSRTLNVPARECVCVCKCVCAQMEEALQHFAYVWECAHKGYGPKWGQTQVCVFILSLCCYAVLGASICYIWLNPMYQCSPFPYGL